MQSAIIRKISSQLRHIIKINTNAKKNTIIKQPKHPPPAASLELLMPKTRAKSLLSSLSPHVKIKAPIIRIIAPNTNDIINSPVSFSSHHNNVVPFCLLPKMHDGKYTIK